MKYLILKPIYKFHNDAWGNRVRDEKGAACWLVRWQIVGQCNSMEHARQLGFTAPVLELITKE